MHNWLNNWLTSWSHSGLAAQSIVCLGIFVVGGEHQGDGKELAPKVLFAWKDAGATVVLGREKKNERPLFVFEKVPVGVLATLPDPGVPFELDLPVTANGIRELSGLISLRHLYVSNVIGLSELNALTGLERLSLSGKGVTNAGLREVAGLSQLQHLSLSYTSVTDAGLKHFSKLKKLESLSAPCNEITGEGIKHLKNLGKLSEVDLTSSAVTEYGLKAIADLRGLEVTRLDECKLSMAGLRALAASKSLRILSLKGSNVTDEELKGLSGLSTLQSLNLSDTYVTGKGICFLPDSLRSLNLHLLGTKKKNEKQFNSELRVEGLLRLINLRELNLKGRVVTDQDLKALCQLDKLELLDVSFPKVTEYGVAQLRQMLPKCNVRVSKY